MQDVAEREQRLRDLRGQVRELTGEHMPEVLFMESSPRRNKIDLWSMENGERIPVPEYMVRAALSKTLPDGRYMFTGEKSEAPPHREGKVKCFLHAESPERESGVLDLLGLAGKFCIAGKLASKHSKRMHQLHRHKQESAAYEEYLGDQKEQATIERQERQLQATLEIARGRSEPERKKEYACETCGASFDRAVALSGHRRKHEKEALNASKQST